MLDLGFASAILPDFSLDHVLNFASNNGFKCVEIMCWPKNNGDSRRYAGVSHIDVDNLNEKTIAAIKYQFRQSNIYPSALGYYPNTLDPEPGKSEFHVEHIKKIIDAANLLGISTVNTFIGRVPNKNIDDNLAIVSEVWPSIIKYAEAKGVRIGIENCPMFFTNDEWPGGKNIAISPAIWDKIFTILPSNNIGLNYDPSHMIWQMMDEIQPLYDYKEKLFHIHLKDAKLYRNKLNRVGIMANPLEYHSPKLPGFGDVNWRGFFGALTEVRYRGPVVIEVEDKAFEANITDVQSAILTSRNYLRQFLV